MKSPSFSSSRWEKRPDIQIQDTSLFVKASSQKLSPRQLIKDCILNHATISNEEDAFYVADLGEVERSYRQWQRYLPQVHPHYAVKCNADPGLILRLASLGCNFDCASITEITLILSLDISPERIIFSHPVKAPKAVSFAQQHGVRNMTFDNAEELQKIARSCPEANLYLRIAADDTEALTRLSSKFGATTSTAIELFAVAQQLRLKIIGLAFHVGSGATNVQAYITAIQEAKHLINKGAAYGFCVRILDIGGGFTIDSFPAIAPKINTALEGDELFSSPDFFIIAEPGRYMSESSMTLACNVIGRRVRTPSEEGPSMLYLNDGLYSSFLNLAFERPEMNPKLLRKADRAIVRQGLHSYSIWGPTCDSNDLISCKSDFDEEVEIGDWLFFEDFGAYTQSTATSFNGFPPTNKVLYLDTEATSLDRGTVYQK
ncbi:uncharacterized protein KY384_000600 [Bacidia gigantensis]|uniref:uncharacterized protein n=1 Tax=Bacidia gigantensis TaxID=2732470 RepID=UPI001D044973|nr:uncharacterized protein KY384_000600 [Bacidia gigantensis]KAG8525840.1 hypothetical protein KY384_000600 [Bacidia gigantensis]